MSLIIKKEMKLIKNAKLDSQSQLSSTVVLTVIVAALVIAAFAVFLALRPHVISSGAVSVPASVTQENQGYLETLESLSPVQRKEFVNQNMDRQDMFRATATPAQKTEFAACMGNK